VTMFFDAVCRSLLRLWRQKSRPSVAPQKYELLAVSADVCFFSSVICTARPYGWTVRWVKSAADAARILKDRPIPVVIYDCWPGTDDWAASAARLKMVSEKTCIVMAAQLPSEELWRKAIATGFYDVVCRKGHQHHLVATLRFACEWSAASRRRSEGLAGASQTTGICQTDDAHLYSRSSPLR
jgi:DNA-binding NtrC family response regulator